MDSLVSVSVSEIDGDCGIISIIYERVIIQKVAKAVVQRCSSVKVF